MILRSVAAMAVAVVAAGIPPATAAGLMHFSVTQVRQLEVGIPTIRAYLDLTHADGQPLAALSESSISATLGEWQAELVQLAPFASMRQGVAFVFLVDISRSLSPELFRRMASGIETWVDGLGPADRAAIIAFGESSQLVVDFTDDKTRLLAGLRSLGPTDDLTLLHQALADGLELSRRLDSELPGRRAVVMFSDGKDEGSVYVAEDVLAKLRDDPAPIYAIGYSRLADPAERQAYLSLLRRYAANSGGSFFAAEQTRFAEAYDSIRQRIGEVWVADLSCEACRPDGRLSRLQVQVTLDGQVLSGGGSVRLLPLATAAETQPPSTPQEIPEATTAGQPTTAKPRPATTSDFVAPQARLWMWMLLPFLLIGAIVIWRIRVTRRRRRARELRARLEMQTLAVQAPIDPRSEPSVLDPPMPIPIPRERPFRPPPTRQPQARSRPQIPPKQVRLIVVRGSRKGRQYSFVVVDRAVVGKRSDCDCILTDETGIDQAQFELLQADGGLFIRNLSERLPTLVSGRPLAGRIRLASDTLIGTGDTVLRIVFY